MNKDKFLSLLAKKLAKDISSDETVQLNNAIKGNEEYKQIADRLSKYFNQSKTKNSKMDKLRNTWSIIAKAESENFQGTFDYTRSIPNIFNIRYLSKISAILALVITSSIVIYQLSKKTISNKLYTVTATNQKSFKLLEDGTKIWLNKNSSIRYNQVFGKHKREIFLKGEAYFDVVKNSEIPLFVHLDNIDIEVKGTAFNVNAYQRNPSVEVALIRGLIQVSQKADPDVKVLLRPNQKLIIPQTNATGENKKFLLSPINRIALLDVTKWTSDTLTFHKEKLKDLIIQLEKKYERKIEIHSAQLKEKRFSGKFINETLQQALDALKLSYPLTYTINNKFVIIKD